MVRLFLIAACLILINTPVNAKAPAGDIGSIKGSGVLERGRDVIEGATGVGVQTMDTAVTARGTMRIDFIDETRVDITEHSRLVIDEFVYDPNSGKGSLSIKASLGGIRYASGQIARNYRQNVKISTPSATIGVRGTDFVMIVDEMGGSMITLLPSCDIDGNCYTGEIEVETDVGTVLMNQAFQSTMTSTRWEPPSPPLIIDSDERLLTQLIILRKRTPYEDEEFAINKKARELYDFLGLDFLEFGGLEDDLLNVDDIWVTALDETDHLLQDMLYDMLDALNAALMAIFKDELQRQNEEFLKEEKNIYGYDSQTGIRFDKIDNGYVWFREDGVNTTRIQMQDTSDGYSLNVQQGDFYTYDFRVGNNTNNSIDIIQQN